MTQQTDAEAFRVLFDVNYSALLAYSVRRVGVYDDAKDVVAETFSIAWRRWEDLPGNANEQRMWLYGTAGRVLANRRRGQIRFLHLRERLSGSVDGSIPDHTTSIEDTSDLTSAISALNLLSDGDREILLLSIWEDLSVGEVAAVLGRSKANVSVRLHRAKTRLRDEFFRLMKDPDVAGHVNDRRAHGDIAPETTR